MIWHVDVAELKRKQKRRKDSFVLINSLFLFFIVNSPLTKDLYIRLTIVN